MKTRHILLSFSVLLFAFTKLIAQPNTEFDSKNFTDRKAFKEANGHYEDANSIFKKASEDQNAQLKYFIDQNHYLPNGINELAGAGGDGFKLALDEYLIANAFNANSALCNFRIAVCYYNQPAQKLMGLTYCEKAVQLNPKGWV